MTGYEFCNSLNKSKFNESTSINNSAKITENNNNDGHIIRDISIDIES